jgi:hypothetical protein
LNFLLPDVFSSSEDFDEWFEKQGGDQKKVVEQLHKVSRISMANIWILLPKTALLKFPNAGAASFLAPKNQSRRGKVSFAQEGN